MSEKRFEIIESAIIDGARVIKDNDKKYTFASTFETATLINYRKALNELNNENKELKMGINSLKLLVQDWEALDEEKDEQLDRQSQALKKLKKENEQLKSKYSEQCTQLDFLKDENKHMRYVLNENKQLKQRNTNQYNQLNELWQIIEEENWEKLIAMKKQLKEDEERLQKEWKCYE